MVYVLRVPSIVIEGATARVEAVHVSAGDSLERGTPLFDFSVDLGAIVGHLCPPITCHRAVAHEPGQLLTLAVEPGAVFEANAELGLIGSGADDPVDAPPSRAFRVLVAGVVWRPEMWSSSELT